MPVSWILLLLGTCLLPIDSYYMYQISPPAYGPYKYPFQDPSATWVDRVEDLVNHLTLEEIVRQSQVIYKEPTPGITRLGIKPYIWVTECLRGQRHTNTTAFPQALGLASSFSEALIHDVAQAVSYEARAHWNGNRKEGIYETFDGLSCFSPVINIVRHPLWGRNQETYGEDPYLSGKLAQHYVRGVQGGHPRYIRTSAGCKHFDAHGGPENHPVSRMSFDVKVSMRDWRMTFLPQFKMCVEAGTWNLMCSYNSINGIPACANQQLLTHITRKEWGFKGFIVSDRTAIQNIITRHHYLNDTVDVAAACIKAGCNLELGTTVYNSQIDAVKQGKLTEQEIRNNVKPLFMTRMRLGEFDPEFMNPYNKIDNSVIQSDEHRKLALIAAMKSFVLLKNNNNFLPLKTKLKSIGVVGSFGNVTDQLFGDYSSDIQPQYTMNVLTGLSQLASSVKYAAGCSQSACIKYNASEVQEAATGVDVVVVALGTGQSVESEGNDRTTLELPGHQLDLLKDAVTAGKGAPVLLLLFNAGPLDVSWAKSSPKVTSILECYFPAQASGEAIYHTLTSTGGDSVPAGRLPVTWPSHLDQVPPMTDYTMEGRTYRYYKGTPLYPFGYGLSYTRFHYLSVSVSPSKIGPGEDVTVSVTVQNTGKYYADEVVQVYISWTNNSVPVPKLQLAGFRRDSLDVGEKKTMEFVITAERISVWIDDNIGWGILTGIMGVYAGGQQPGQDVKVPSNVLQSSFTITV